MKQPLIFPFASCLFALALVTAGQVYGADSDHRGGNLVNILPPRPGGPCKGFFKIGLMNPELLHSVCYVAVSHSGGIFSKTQASFHANADKQECRDDRWSPRSQRHTCC